MRLAAFIFYSIVSLSVCAQPKFSVKDGEIDFTSNAKLELIKAQSKNLQGIVNPTNNQFAFIVKVQSFEGFNSKLQKDHFNEKYMESDKYYDATFTGKIMEAIDFTKDGEYDVKANGSLTIHGKKQPRTIPAKVKVEKGMLVITSNFTIALADHDIKVPEIVSTKIATEIYVKLHLVMASK
jgi:polyisoprenoid-binding protein YceI